MSTPQRLVVRRITAFAAMIFSLCLGMWSLVVGIDASAGQNEPVLAAAGTIGIVATCLALLGGFLLPTSWLGAALSFFAAAAFALLGGQVLGSVMLQTSAGVFAVLAATSVVFWRIRSSNP